MKILFICTHNRCRSILCEAITNHLSDGRLSAFSAGSSPAGEVHPRSIEALRQRGINTEGLKSQSWDEFEAIKPDVVITVCDSAANEVCPVWFGECARVHWGLPDPSKLQAPETEIQAAFFSVMDTIEQRVNSMLKLELETMTKQQRQTALQSLAQGV